MPGVGAAYKDVVITGAAKLGAERAVHVVTAGFDASPALAIRARRARVAARPAVAGVSQEIAATARPEIALRAAERIRWRAGALAADADFTLETLVIAAPAIRGVARRVRADATTARR